MDYDFNMSGNRCSLIGAKCPGNWINDKTWGCPHWREMWVEMSEKDQPVMWKGCGVLMDTHLTLGITKAVNHAASTVQAVRNVTARGFLGLAMSAGIDPSSLMSEISNADRDTNEGRSSLLLEKTDG